MKLFETRNTKGQKGSPILATTREEAEKYCRERFRDGYAVKDELSAVALFSAGQVDFDTKVIVKDITQRVGEELRKVLRRL